MLDIFHNYSLQREDLLARIAQELQLDQTRIKRMESAYNSVAELLKKDEDFFNGLDIEVYAQGSKRIGTTVKPINKEDFDLDTVLHLFDPYYNHSPDQLYNKLVIALEKDSYYKSIMEKKKRCIRLNYKGDFHMDILPACMPNYTDKEMIHIPEKARRNWSSGNPKGFAKWFKFSSESAKEPMLKKFSAALLEAKVDSEPLPNDLYLKTPLQRAVQLLKRYRDIYFENRDFKVSSIVITTLAAHLYQGENTIYETLDNILNRVKNDYNEALNKNIRFKVLNPVNNSEDFTDSWTSNHYQSFYSFIDDLYFKWHNLKNSFEKSQKNYIELFGEGVYKKTLNEQFRNFSNSTNDIYAKTSGLITGGLAHTNSRGTINEKQGIKNGDHHSYGGEY